MFLTCITCINCHKEIQVESDLRFQQDENHPFLFELFTCPLCGKTFSEEELPRAEREGLHIAWFWEQLELNFHPWVRMYRVNIETVERVFALDRLAVERSDYDSIDIYWYSQKQNCVIKYEEDEQGYDFRIVKNLDHIYSPTAKRKLQERGIGKK